MQNEARIFSYQPEKEPEATPVEGGEKIVKIIEFPLEEIVSDLPTENKSAETAQSLHDKIRDLQDEIEKLKYNPSEKIRDILREENILMQVNGVNVFDIETFLGDEVQEKFRRTSLNIAKGKQKNVTKPMIFEALKDLSVASREDYLQCIEENRNVHEKPLFNVPESLEEAFDLEKIKNKEYYLNYWEMFGSESSGQRPTWKHDMIAKDWSVINMREFAFATKLFRDFQAQRNENGELKVFDKEKQEHVKLSDDWLRANFGAYGNYDQTYNSSHQFLISNCSNLLQKGLVRLEDFRIITNSPSGNLLRKEFASKSSSPDIMINGVRYYIGREKLNFEGRAIPKENIKIVILDQNTAGVVLINGGQEKVICTLDLLSDEEKNKKRQETENGSGGKLSGGEISARTAVNKKEMNDRLHSWKRTEDNPRLENETPEAYAERMSSIADYGYIKKVTEDFALQGIGIHNLSWREQQWLVSAAFELRNDYPKLLEFGEQYGIEGLKTFLSCEYNLEYGREILNIGEKLSFENASLIFAKYNEISNVAEKNVDVLASDYLKEKDKNITKDQYEKITASLLRKSKDLLLDFSQKISDKEKQIDERVLMDDLEKSKTEIILLAAALKNGIKLEQLEGWEISILENPSENQQAQMIGIEEQNWNQIGKIKDEVVASFQAAFKDEQKRKWYVAEFEKKVASFMVFTQTKQGKLYFGSFNVDFEARGLGVGNVMMERAVAEEAKENILEATVSPRIPAGTAYVERMDLGFVINGITDYHQTGEPLFCIEADKQKNPSYHYRNEGKESEITKEEIKKQVRNYEDLDQLVGTENFALEFDVKNDFEKMKATMEKLLIVKDNEGENVAGQEMQNKYLITRYFKDKDNEDVRYFAFEAIKN